MREVSFSIPVSGIISIDGNEVTITINRADTTVFLGPEIRLGGRISFESGKTMFDIILETAQEIVQQKGVNRFSAPELYSAAREKYPQLKRNSFMSRVIACTPDHPSFKHYSSTRDYFSHIGTGLYWLNEKYMPEKISDQDITENRRKLFNNQ